LLHVESEVVVEDVGRFPFVLGDRCVDSGLAQLVVKAIGIVGPTDDVVILPRVAGRRQQETLSRDLGRSIYFQANPVRVSQTSA
jgi:hypothetical protein